MNLLYLVACFQRQGCDGVLGFSVRMSPVVFSPAAAAQDKEDTHSDDNEHSSHYCTDYYPHSWEKERDTSIHFLQWNVTILIIIIKGRNIEHDVCHVT